MVWMKVAHCREYLMKFSIHLLSSVKFVELSKYRSKKKVYFLSPVEQSRTLIKLLVGGAITNFHVWFYAQI
jgi:hypothetical protein